MELGPSQQAAQQAGLRYVNDQQPGIARVRAGSGFRYTDPDGKPIKEKLTLSRINALAIPPAWQRVWICPITAGHLQATGFDVRGRKQYRYHAQWTQLRNQCKFDCMQQFGEALPAIRRRVRKDIKSKNMPRQRVLACVVKLLDEALIRVGNDEYARDNNSFGLTTIRNHHVRVRGAAIRFRFKGKSGKAFETAIHDPRIAAIVRRCQDLPGQELFAYVDDEGKPRDITSSDVNEYLFEITAEGFTSKDFRTWGGTVVAAQTLQTCGPCTNGDGPIKPGELKLRCNSAIKVAAAALRNTPATCRKFYVHPKLADAYSQGLLERAFALAKRTTKPRELRLPERAILKLLNMM